MNAKSSRENLILVVDDSPETLGMLNDTLEQAGMTTLVALEGVQALNIARRIIPDVILLDALMPVMDGFELCRQLKADPELRAIPVIFMTGLSDTESVVKAFEVGGVDYVTKPVNTAELIARMRVHLANARLTLSARSALDTAGQFMFSVTRDGQVVWSTPQVNQLFDAADDGHWLSDNLHAELKIWLARAPAPGMGIDLTAPHRALRVVVLGTGDDGEFLLRLQDREGPNEAEQLRAKLPITARESEVLLWLARGKTNREIGEILGTSPRTVNKHLEQVFRKLGVENRTSAAAIVLKHLEQS